MHPAWSATTILWLPASAASTWASWNASTAGFHSENFTLLAPFVSIHVAASPSISALEPTREKRVSISTISPLRTLKLSVLLSAGTKQFLLPGASQSSASTGVTQTL